MELQTRSQAGFYRAADAFGKTSRKLLFNTGNGFVCGLSHFVSTSFASEPSDPDRSVVWIHSDAVPAIANHFRCQATSSPRTSAPPKAICKRRLPARCERIDGHQAVLGDSTFFLPGP